MRGDVGGLVVVVGVGQGVDRAGFGFAGVGGGGDLCGAREGGWVDGFDGVGFRVYPVAGYGLPSLDKSVRKLELKSGLEQ